MKKLNYYMMALASLFITGCQNDEAMFSNNRLNPDVKVEASLECDADSRTALNNENKVVWSLGDRLSVFVGSADAHNTFVLKSGENTTYATFESEGTFSFGTGTESGSSSFANLAYYPHSEELVVVEQEGKYTIDATIPEKQTYVANSFGKNASPMVAVSGTMNFAFKNVASMLKVSLKKDVSITSDVTIIKATVTSNANKIAGECCITASAEELPSVEMTDNAASLVTLDCGTGVSLNSETATEFYFVIPPGKYEANDLVLTFYDSSNQYFESPITAQNEFVRSKYLNFNRTFIVSGNASGVDAAQDALNSGSSKVLVTITDTDEEPTLNLPETTSEEPTELSFEEIPADKTVTIQAGTEGANVANSLTIKASSTGSNVFNINLPNSTVTLDANGETATYDEVTAATAENTLIIGQGVTVNKLIVKKGHVRVRGTVSEISRDGNQNGEVTYIIMEQGANIPNNLGEGFKVISAAEWDLRKAIAEGGTVTLSEDVTLTSPIFVENTVTLNLNGKNITTSGESFYVQGVVSAAICVKENGNLTVIGEGTIDSQNTQDYAVEVRGGELNIEGGEYVGCVTSAYALTGTINISGGEFTVCNDHAYDYAYVLNLLDANGKNGTASINVTGGKFYKFNPAVNASENPGKDYVQAGYSSVAADDYYVVSEGVKNELSLRKAIAEGGIVTLSEDITLTSPLFVENTVTLNLNGKNITTTGESFYVQGVVSAAICVKENGNLTVIGEGTIDSQNTQDYAVEVRGGELNIEGGEYVGCVTSAYALTGTINISGGEFTVCNDHAYDYAYVLNLLDANGKNGTASINVTGGKFYKFNPAVNASENPGKDYVQAGYSSVAADDYYVVSEGTENE